MPTSNFLSSLSCLQSYSPAPESGIRSTLQPSSSIYGLYSDSEEEGSTPSTSPPLSPQAASLEGPGDNSDSATPAEGPVPLDLELVVGLRQIPRRIPESESKGSARDRRSGSPAKGSRGQMPTPTAGLLTMSSASSSQRNSQNPDNSGSAFSNWQTYILDENGQKKYPCLHCDKMFGRSHDRKRHMDESTSCRGAQLERGQERGTAPKWVCCNCGDSFSRRDSMNRHMKNPDACKAHKHHLR